MLRAKVVCLLFVFLLLSLQCLRLLVVLSGSLSLQLVALLFSSVSPSLAFEFDLSQRPMTGSPVSNFPSFPFIGKGRCGLREISPLSLPPSPPLSFFSPFSLPLPPPPPPERERVQQLRATQTKKSGISAEAYLFPPLRFSIFEDTSSVAPCTRLACGLH